MLSIMNIFKLGQVKKKLKTNKLNKPSQLGTKRTPHGGQHFRIVYGGF